MRRIKSIELVYTYGVGECDEGITAVSTNKRRIVHPNASPAELNLMEATPTGGMARKIEMTRKMRD